MSDPLFALRFLAMSYRPSAIRSCDNLSRFPRAGFCEVKVHRYRAPLSRREAAQDCIHFRTGVIRTDTEGSDRAVLNAVTEGRRLHQSLSRFCSIALIPLKTHRQPSPVRSVGPHHTDRT